MLSKGLDLPERPQKKRSSGLTLMIDKGLSLNEATDRTEVGGEWIDKAKIAWGSAYLLGDRIRPKLELYKQREIETFPGGVLFEAFAVRNKIEAYRKLVRGIGFPAIEISDGSIDLEHDEKCRIIESFSGEFSVISEFGPRSNGKVIPIKEWPKYIQREINAGASYVTLEGGGSGNVGIYAEQETPLAKLVDTITGQIPPEKLIWETPQKAQQIWFIQHLGPNVNLANIDPTDIIGLETLRLGLRADTLSLLLK